VVEPHDLAQRIYNLGRRIHSARPTPRPPDATLNQTSMILRIPFGQKQYLQRST